MSKVQSLVDAIFKSTPKVFYDRPPELTADDIAAEISVREQTDQMLAEARMTVIRNLFSDTPTKLNPFL